MGTYNTSYILLVVAETTVTNETAFHENWLITRIAFSFCQIDGLIFELWDVCGRGSDNL